MKHRFFNRTVVVLLVLAAPACAYAALIPGQEDAGPTFAQEYPWVHELVIGLLAAGMVVALIYFLRPAKAGGGSADFRIIVEADDVQFRGRFPATLQPLVEEFLVEDCQIPGKYEVRGTWEEGRLVVEVRGDHAKLQEQRIRNFLKLHVKRPA